MKQTPLLLGIAAILIAVLFGELVSPPDAFPIQASHSLPRGTAPLRAGAGASRSDQSPDRAVAQAFAVALPRPLFSHNRRPNEIQHPDVTPVPRPEALPRLAGVVVGPSARRAFFADTNGRSRGMAEGDGMEGFVIRVIRPGMVILSGPEGERVLRPSHANATEADAVSR